MLFLNVNKMRMKVKLKQMLGLNCGMCAANTHLDVFPLAVINHDVNNNNFS